MAPIPQRPGNSRRSRQSRFSSRRIFTSGGSQKLLARSFEQGDDLLTSDTGKSLDKVVDGLPCFKVFEETLDRYSRTNENRCTSQNLRIGVKDLGEIRCLHKSKSRKHPGALPTRFFIPCLDRAWAGVCRRPACAIVGRTELAGGRNVRQGQL